MRFDSTSHIILNFVALVVLYFVLKALYAFWLSKKEMVKANLLCFFTRILSNEQPSQANMAELLPTGYQASSMATAHADLQQLSSYLKVK